MGSEILPGQEEENAHAEQKCRKEGSQKRMQEKHFHRWKAGIDDWKP
jgi:hypothetical protein